MKLRFVIPRQVGVEVKPEIEGGICRGTAGLSPSPRIAAIDHLQRDPAGSRGAARLWLGVRDRPRLTNCVTDRLTAAELLRRGLGMLYRCLDLRLP